MATLDELQQGLIKADAAGNAEDAKAFADAIRSMQAAQAPRINPTEGMSTFEKGAAGLGKAIADTGLGLRQVGARVFGSDEDVKRLQAEVAERRALDEPLLKTGAGMTGNILGNVGMAVAPGGALMAGGRVAAAVPNAVRLAQALQTAGRAAALPTSIPGAAAVGAVQGAAQPSVSGNETLTNAGIGTVAGAAPAALARVLAPETRQAVRTLMDEGVRPTFGQLMGGRLQALEDKLTSVPGLGDAITSARRGAIEDLNRAAYNRALAPIGQRSQAAVGREGVADVSGRLGAAYDDVLPRVQFSPDQQYIQDIARALNRGAQELPDAQLGQLNRIADAQVFGKINGPMSGVELKPVQSELNRVTRGMRGDPSYDVRNLGGIVGELNQATRDAVVRSTPAEAEALRNIDRGYGNYALIRDAAARTGSKDGIASPEALQAAVRAADKSVGKGNFARGTAQGQDLSDAAVNVLGRGYPDSGTAGRVMLGMAVPAALGGGGVALDNDAALAGAAGLGATAVPYLPYARDLAAILLAGRRPGIIQSAAPAVRALSVPAAALAVSEGAR